MRHRPKKVKRAGSVFSRQTGDHLCHFSTVITRQEVAKIVLFGEVCGTCQSKPARVSVTWSRSGGQPETAVTHHESASTILRGPFCRRRLSYPSTDCSRRQQPPRQLSGCRASHREAEAPYASMTLYECSSLGPRPSSTAQAICLMPHGFSPTSCPLKL